jgi:outer membrane protein assembly factor BamB
MIKTRRQPPEPGQRPTLRSFKIGAAALLLLLAGCSDGTFFGEKEGPPLPGTRVAILEASRSIIPQAEVAGVQVTVPAPEERVNWPQSVGRASHVGGNPALAQTLQVLWRNTDAVGAKDEARRPLSPPIIANGRVFVLDAVLNVRAYDAETGEELWAVGTAPPGEHDGFGGGLATDGVRVYVAGGHSQALALEADTGRLFWRKDLPGPVRSAPTTRDGQLFIVTADNRLIALRTEDGERIWDVPGGSTGAALLGGASPAANNDAVVAALTTGEVLAVRRANGRGVWRNSLAALRRFDFGAKLSDIAGHPVLTNDAVYAVSAAGRAAAFSLRTGNAIWEQRVGSTQTPWVAGDWVYIMTTDAELVCLDRHRGFVRWVVALPRYEDVEDQSGEYFYAGPVMAGGNLVLVRSDGELSLHSPETGAVIGTFDAGDDVILPPVIANQALYILADNGALTALR